MMMLADRTGSTALINVYFSGCRPVAPRDSLWHSGPRIAILRPNERSSPLMTRLVSSLAVLSVLVVSASCGSPAAPSQTRIIQLSGDINFGEVEVGQSTDRMLRITNIGNAAMTVDGIVGSTDFVEWFFTSLQTTRTIQPGASIEVLIQFRPTQARHYLGIGNVRGDMTSGTNSFNVSGVGVVR
jgi:hypothetical protein